MIRKGLRPGFKFGFDTPGEREDFRRVLPFRRSWIAIAVLAAFDAAFIIPAVITFRQAISEWSSFDSLFDLVLAIFLSAWLLGWVIAPLILTGILLLMLSGRETLKAGPGTVEIFLGISFVGVTASYDVSKMRNLRFEEPPKKSGKAWRGSHLVFDYGANTIAFGSNIRGDEVAELRGQLEFATGAKIRRGNARAEETADKWEPDVEPAPYLPVAATVVSNTPLLLTSPTTLVLIIANLIPVAGSVFLDWNLGDVMLLYWAESAVIGFFNVCKIIVIGRWAALFAGPFFAAHFGGFMAVHFLLIYTIFIEGVHAQGSAGGDLAEVALLFSSLWPALAALFLSHAYSFYANFLARREYRGKTVKDQMSEPYSRIIFMQMVLIFGGGLTMVLGSPVPVLLIMIALKIFFDIKAHLKQHSGGKHKKSAAA
jgi:hypothetical protein